MRLEPTKLSGPVIIHPEVYGDERGFFLESYNREKFLALGIDLEFNQDNHSRSIKDTLRGLHFQTRPGQAKLVRCIRGTIWDVAVDLRLDSPTLGEWTAVELSEDNHRMFLIPRGFAHGFCVLSDSADVVYKVSSVYDAATEAGIAWDDPEIGVEWPVAKPILSSRDQANPSLREWLANQAGGKG